MERKANEKNNLKDKVQNFYKRWNIEYNEQEKRINDFKNWRWRQWTFIRQKMES